MTRNRELDLADIFDCNHEPEIPVVEKGEIIFWLCRCGRRHNPKQVSEPTIHQDTDPTK